MGSLPFDKTAELRENGGNPVAGGDAIPVGLWPAREQQASPVGEYLDYEGVTPKQYVALMEEPDRSLVIDGIKYKILSAVAPLGAPWGSLRLRKMGSGV